jgi:hypothetical protein
MPAAFLAHDGTYPTLRDREFLRGLGDEVPPLADTWMTGSGRGLRCDRGWMCAQWIMCTVARRGVLGALEDKRTGGDEA